MKRNVWVPLAWSLGVPLVVVMATLEAALVSAVTGGASALVVALLAWVFGADPASAAARAGLLVGGITAAIIWVVSLVVRFGGMAEKIAELRMKEALAEVETE